MKKKGAGCKEEFPPDCESPAGMKRRVGRRFCFALSDRSRGLLYVSASLRYPLPSLSSPPVGKNDERKVVCCSGGQNIFILVEWRVNAAARDVPVSFF